MKNMGKVKRSLGFKIYVCLLCLLTAATLAFIWGNSMLTEASSAEESQAVYGVVQPFFDSVFGEGVITEQILRKIAHGTEFFVLGLELTLLISAFGGYGFKGWAFVLSEGISVALIDETIQYITERGAAVMDVWIDVSGVFVVSVFAGIIGLIVRAVKKSRRKKSAE